MAFMTGSRLATAMIAAIALAWTSPVAAEKSSVDYFVHNLPGAPDPLLKMHAGHIEITPEHNGNIFFWLFHNKHIAKKQRTVIWLNGGPGCSSEDGALMEVGPYRLTDDHTLVLNNGSWNEFANLVFVDNPVGTGFSYTDTNNYVHELDVMADQFIVFLEKFYAIFPEYEGDDLYFAGESYAGQHIPYIAKHILARNKLPTTKHRWNLAGLLIGNGWVAPVEQYEAYLSFAYAKGIVTKGSEMANELEVQRRICAKDLATAANLPVDLPSCETILQILLRITMENNECINMYDVRLRDSYPSCGMNWPPDLVHVTPYLRRKDVVEALHVSPHMNTGWVECNGMVGSQFDAGKSAPSVAFLPDLLEEVPIVLFSGSEDLICNHVGTEMFINNLQWNGGKGFELSPGTWAPRRDWTFEGEPAGFWQEARNLTYVLFYNSSHMVPLDYSRRTRDMLDRFMKLDIGSTGGPLSDSRLDGEPGLGNAVGGAAGNGTAAQEAEQAKLDEAKWQAYRKSGEIVLVIVVIAASAWAWYIIRDRRKRSSYLDLMGSEGGSGSCSSSGRALLHGTGIEGIRSKRINRDVEANDFDESELDDLHVETATEGRLHDVRYSIGGESDEEADGR